MGSRTFDWVLGVVSWGKERSEEDRKAILEGPCRSSGQGGLDQELALEIDRRLGTEEPLLRLNPQDLVLDWLEEAK